INAGASDVVTIRGLTVIAGAGSSDGVQVNSAKSVTIRDCSSTGFAGSGIHVGPIASLNVELRSVALNNNGVFGLHIIPSGPGPLTCLVSDPALNGNGNAGAFLDGQVSTGTFVATLNVTAAANGSDGVVVTSPAGKAHPVVMVTGAKLANNAATGL